MPSWRAPDTLLENLQLIADGVVAVAGSPWPRSGSAGRRARARGRHRAPRGDRHRDPAPADARRAGARRGLGTPAVRPARARDDRPAGRLGGARGRRQRRPGRLAPAGHARRPAVRRPRGAARDARHRRTARRPTARPGASAGARAVRHPGRSRRARLGGARVVRRAGADGRHGQGDRAHQQRPAEPRRACCGPASGPCSTASGRSGCGSRPSPWTRARRRSTCPSDLAAACRRRSWPSPSSPRTLLLAPPGRDDHR